MRNDARSNRPLIVPCGRCGLPAEREGILSVYRCPNGHLTSVIHRAEVIVSTAEDKEPSR